MNVNAIKIDDLIEAGNRLGLHLGIFPDLATELVDWETRYTYNTKNGVETNLRNQTCVLTFRWVYDAQLYRSRFAVYYGSWRIFRRGARVTLTLKGKAVA